MLAFEIAIILCSLISSLSEIFVFSLKLLLLFERGRWCVWIELIFTETENWNWKHCSEIIFKCVNSIMGSIFNKKVAKNDNLWDRKQYTYILFTVDKVNNCGLKKKKKKEENVEKNVDVGFSSKQTVTECLMYAYFERFSFYFGWLSFYFLCGLFMMQYKF